MLEISPTFQMINRTDNQDQSSVLRKTFNALEGDVTMRSIHINYVTQNIIHLPERPSYTPSVVVLQIRHTTDGRMFVFAETVYSSNQYLMGLERRLREHSVDVRAVNFDEIPMESKHLYELQHPLVPTQVMQEFDLDERGEVVATETVSVDYQANALLRMAQPEDVDGFLNDLEGKAEYVAHIEEVIPHTHKEDVRIPLAYERRGGNEDMTTEHLVFSAIPL